MKECASCLGDCSRPASNRAESCPQIPLASLGIVVRAAGNLLLKMSVTLATIPPREATGFCRDIT